MSATNVHLIQRKIPIGTEISVELKSGRTTHGALVEIGEAHIMLRTPTGEQTILEEFIGAWTSGSLGSLVTEPPSQAKESAPPATETSVSEEHGSNHRHDDQGAERRGTTNGVEPLVGLAVELELRFKSGIQTAAIEQFGPNFTLSPSEVDSYRYSDRKLLQQSWERLKSQYEYAVRTGEFSRIKGFVAGHERLVTNFPESNSARYNLGCIYLQAGDFERAARCFQRVADFGHDPRAFCNLAFAYVQAGRHQDAQRALLDFFKTSSFTPYISAWYTLIRLSDQRESELLSELLALYTEERDSADIRLLTETAAFLLIKLGERDQAYTLLASPGHSGADTESAFSQLRSIAVRLTSSAAPARAAVRVAVRDPAPAVAVDSRAPASSRQGETGRRENHASPATSGPTGFGRRTNNYYAQGLVAWNADKDLPRAELLFRNAIRERDNPDAAVKNLASVLQQQERDDEAVELLSSYRDQAMDPYSIGSTLATTMAHSGKHEQAIQCLKGLLAATPRAKLPNIQKRIASSYLQLRDYGQAELHARAALDANPEDATARRWLDALVEAKQTGRLELLQPLAFSEDVLAGVTTTLSDFLVFHLDRCDYTGLEAPKIVSRSFTASDADTLAERARNEGVRRARPRAALFLTAAKILVDLQSEDELQMRRYLANYCAAMGAAQLAERSRPLDVAASYYTEFLLIAPEADREVDLGLRRYVLLLGSEPVERILSATPPLLADCLRSSFRVPSIKQSVFENLLYISALNREVAKLLLSQIYKQQPLRREAYSFCSQLINQTPTGPQNNSNLIQVWDAAAQLVRAQRVTITDQFTFLRSATANFDQLANQRYTLSELADKVRGGFDKQRIRNIAELIDYVSEYSQQGLYSEQERLAIIIKSKISELINDIEDSPTKLSIDVLRPYLLALENTIVQHFGGVERTAEPQALNLGLSEDSYSPDATGQIVCQIEIANEPGKSPAKLVRVVVDPSPTDEYLPLRKETTATQALIGGDKVSCELPLTITEKAKVAKVFTLYLRMVYGTRLRDEIEIGPLALPIRLDDPSVFSALRNPYAPWVQQGAVTEERMFYGRGEFISNLLTLIESGPANKSIVIYGQKRAGKTSIIYHLTRQMRSPLLPVPFSIGELVSGFSLSAFLARTARGVDEAFRNSCGGSLPDYWPERPSLETFRDAPELCFHEYMSAVRRAKERTEQLADARIVLILDEFSYIYGEILRGRCPETFMKSWKAIVEQSYFACVLVGQDVMRNFIEAFPNEFQVAQGERVSYLSDEHARQLIVEPIRLEDTSESRYKAGSVERLLTLTAGSPYYLMHFCARLVNYLNERKATYITTGHVERVKDDLIRGNNSLTDAEFDNLLSPGDASVSSADPKLVRAVLRDIALGSRNQRHSERSSIRAVSGPELEAILGDLERRDVIERQGGELYRIRVELFKEWLLFHQ